MPTHAVVLTGQSGAGKDALAKLLVQDYDYTRLAFGDLLRQDVVKYYSLPGLPGDERAVICDGMSFKDLMLEHGARVAITEPARYSVALTKALLGTNGPVVITDCRKPIELHYLKRTSVPLYLVKLSRPDNPHPAKRLDGLLTGREWNDIVNDGEPKQMLEGLRDIMERTLPYVHSMA